MDDSLFISIYLTIVGMVVGSYFLAFISRGSFKQSVAGRSRCASCKRQLRPKDLVPVLSFLLLKGRCRYCLHKLPRHFPLVEAVTGGLFFLASMYSESLTELITSLLLVSLLVLITLTDIQSFRIPNRILLLFSIPLLLLRFVNQPVLFQGSSFIIGLVLLFILLYAYQKGQLGGGDVKLFVVFMVLLGIQSTLLIIMISSMVALLYTITRRSMWASFLEQKRVKLPFAPFISIATIIVYFSPNLV
ncbi:prepilin peptidase [Shouchella sp. 1P09AA]|uniref:prepilin peptidase n=1 Tax=unclassified Shouchella TaxID=2893065 RepID=UPI00399F7271